MPLDATHKATISLDQCQTLRASGKPAAEAAAIFVEKRIDGYRAYQHLADQDAAPVHDALCIASMIEPDIIETHDYYVAVETTGTLTVGRTVIDTNFRSRHGAERARRHECRHRTLRPLRAGHADQQLSRSEEGVGMVVIVTGSSGLLGRHVAAALVEAGHAVLGLDAVAPPAGGSGVT